MIRDVTDSDLERIRNFLEAYRDSSLFLLANLALFGPYCGEHPNSGNYRYAMEAGRVIAVFSLTRRGNLLVQGAGRADLAEPILSACGAEPIEVTGVIGDWLTAEALWRRVCADPQLEPTQSEKDVLFSLALNDDVIAAADSAPRATVAGLSVRALDAGDFQQWDPLNAAYLRELNLPSQLTLPQRREEFESEARTDRWWGAFDGEKLLAIAGLNAVYARLGQVGGVYSRPEARRRGLSRLVMRRLIRDSGTRHHFERLVLFTGEDNVGARRLYESLGFQSGGAFGIFLGTRRSATRPD